MHIRERERERYLLSQLVLFKARGNIRKNIFNSSHVTDIRNNSMIGNIKHLLIFSRLES